MPNMFFQYQAIAITGFVEFSEHKRITNSILAGVTHVIMLLAKNNYETQKISVKMKPLKLHWKLQ